MDLTKSKIQQIKDRLMVDPTLAHSKEFLGMDYNELAEAIKIYSIIENRARSAIVRRTLTQKYNNMQKYGVPSNFCLKKTRDKTNEALSSKESRQRRSVRSKELYSDEGRKKEIFDKIKRARISSGGYDTRKAVEASRSKENLEKRKSTFLERYGVSSVSGVERDKARKSLNKRGLSSGIQAKFSKEALDILNSKERFTEYVVSIDSRIRSRDLVAERLGVGVMTVSRRVKRYGLTGEFNKRGGSEAEKQIFDIITSWGIAARWNDRKEIRPYELDIYIPGKKIAIEYDGEYWHSSEEAKHRDNMKDEMCLSKGILLIRIKEEDYINNQDYCIGRLFEKLGIDGQLVIDTKQVETEEEIPFYDIETESNNHNYLTISGVVHNSVQFGQDLAAAGINYRYQSIDAVKNGVNQPYSALRNTIYDKRISLLDDEDQSEELRKLVKYEGGKVDKPMGGCFTGDTKVSLVDGRSLSFLDLTEETNNKKQNFVYSINLHTKRIEPKLIVKAWMTLKNQRLVRVTLDNGESIKCTPNHRFMLRDGEYKEAQYLQSGQSLMPLYTKYIEDPVFSSYRLYYEPFENKWHYEHRQFVEESKLKKGYVIHHINCNSKDNSPTNLEQLSKEEHTKLHMKMCTGAGSPEAIRKKIVSRKRWFEQNKDSDRMKEIRKKISAGLLNNSKSQEKIKKQAEKVAWIETESKLSYNSMTISQKNGWGNKYSYHLNPERRQKVAREMSDYNKKYKAEEIRNQRWYTDGVDNIYQNKNKPIPAGFNPGRTAPWCKIKNHKVLSVEFLEETQDVYDIQVEDNHNFALSAGVFVHNSDDAAQVLAGWVFAASLNKEQYIQTHAVLNSTFIGSTVAEQRALEEGTISQELISQMVVNEFGAISTGGYTGLRQAYDEVFKTNKKLEDEKRNPFNFF